MEYWINRCLLLIGTMCSLSSCQHHTVIEAELVDQMQTTTGEGALWHPDRQTLFWVDIEGRKLYEYHPSSKSRQEWKFDRMVSTVVPETDSTVVVALQDEIVRLNLNSSRQTSIARIPVNNGGLRCNDGKCGPSGRLWVGTMSLNGKEKAAALYCVSGQGQVKEMISKVSISNGIVWSSQERFMYYIDTPTRRVDRYRYDKSDLEILYDGIAFHIPEGTGVPDGMAIDENGNLWIAQWGGSGVYCYNPYTGDLLAKVEVPAPNVASCAFGGANLDSLYITTARAGLTDEQLKDYPLSGSVFVCKPGVKGTPANKFE